MNAVWLVLCVSLIQGVWCQQQEFTQFASECPEPNGFFADAVQCDKYYACEDNVLTEKLCEDGMVFNDLNPAVEKCDFPLHISCEGRPELQPAQSSLQCPRLNGYFAHEVETNCNQFYFCSKGTANQITCPETLVFSLKTLTCVWPAEAGRVNCKAERLFNFTCPLVDFEVAVAHPRYSDPDDCQYFFVCINGETPRRNGCSFGDVFNHVTKSCDKPINVPDCKDYYKQYFDDYFASLGTGSNIPTPDVLAAAIGSGFKLPEKAKRVRINPNAHNPVAINPPRRRGSVNNAPVRTRTAAPAPAPVRAFAPEPVAEKPATSSASRPLRPQRRRPVRTRPGEITAAPPPTTTTTAPPPELAAADEGDYYYYDDFTEGAPPV